MVVAIIDNNVTLMTPDSGRGKGYRTALSPDQNPRDFRFIPAKQVGDPRNQEFLANCTHVILSGSADDWATGNDQLKPETVQKMKGVITWLQKYEGKVLGVCFGHQMLAIVEDLMGHEPPQSFTAIKIKNMRPREAQPERGNIAVPITITHPNELVATATMWGQMNHGQEVEWSDALGERFQIWGETAHCRVAIIKHRHRPWYGVQFHPETGANFPRTIAPNIKDATQRHGQQLLQRFLSL